MNTIPQVFDIAVARNRDPDRGFFLCMESAATARGLTMHFESLSRDIQIPCTIIIEPCGRRKEVGLSLSELALLGPPFIIKPANTNWVGVGIVVSVGSFKDVIDSWQHHKNGTCLGQQKVMPVERSHHRRWFRVFHAFCLDLL